MNTNEFELEDAKLGGRLIRMTGAYAANFSKSQDETERSAFLGRFITHVHEEASKLGNAALWVSIPPSGLGLWYTTILAACPRAGVTFQHHRVGERKHSDHHVFYAWIQGHDNPVEDAVAPHMTSTGGVAVLVLSPDETEVLLVNEYGKLKLITGAVGRGERAIETAVRETREEVGLLCDERFPALCLGGWQTAGMGGSPNDNLHVFCVRSTSKEFKADGFEIKTCCWEPIAPLLDAFPLENRERWSVVDSKAPLFGRAVERASDKERFSYCMLLWLGSLWARRTANRNSFTGFTSPIEDKNVTMMF